MHFLQNLMSYMLPIQTAVFSQNNETPEGTDRVITNTGAFVTTARNNYVIAKKYV